MASILLFCNDFNVQDSNCFSDSYVQCLKNLRLFVAVQFHRLDVCLFPIYTATWTNDACTLLEGCLSVSFRVLHK